MRRLLSRRSLGLLPWAPLVLLAAGACAHIKEGPPSWVRRGSHVDRDQRIVGVAVATGRPGPLARSTASNRARFEVLRLIEDEPRPARSSPVAGIEVRDLWEAPDGSVWAMAVLER